MLVKSWLSSVKRSQGKKCGNRRPVNALYQDWRLEDRCLLSADPPMPLATKTNPGDVLYYGSEIPLKTITLFNNTGKTVFPFLRDANSRVFMPNDKVGQYDPYDPIREDYRGYVGYTSGGKNYLGLRSQDTITINVPLVFWDGARLDIGTDATYITPPQTPGQKAPINPYNFFFYNPDKSETLRAIVPSRDNNDPTQFSSTGLIMWYHGKENVGPTSDCPEQLTEMTFRDPYLARFPNIPPAEQITLINYDVSYVDSMVLPGAMEAANVPIPNTGDKQSFGWIGAKLDLATMQNALQEFTADNNALLGQYFGGHGYAKFYNPNEAVDGIKIPSGANVIGDGPLNDTRSSFDQNRYRLTSGGIDPIMFSNPGHPNGTILQFDPNIPQSFFETLKAGIAAGKSGWNVTSPNDKSLPPGTRVQDVNVAARQVIITQPTVVSPNLVFGYDFKRPVQDFVAEPLIKLWYSWAQYYLDRYGNTPAPAPAMGHTQALSNVISFDNAVPGLVVGMKVTGPGLPTDGTLCTIMGVAQDNKSVTVSLLAESGATGSYTFGKVQPILGVGQTKTFDLTFGGGDRATALKFAQGVYQLLSVMSTIPNEGLARQILLNAIGCNVGKLPHAGTAEHQEVHNVIRDITKSVLRGVYDFKVVDESQWYPDPKLPTGGANFNVWNLNPFVWFVHKKLGLSGYGFSVDDDVADVGAAGASRLLLSIGGLNGLPNQFEWTPGAPYGKFDGSAIVNLAMPTQISGLRNIDYWRAYPLTPDGPGALVSGPGVQPGTRILSRIETNNTFVLTKPIDTTGIQPNQRYTFTFFGREDGLRPATSNIDATLVDLASARPGHGVRHAPLLFALANEVGLPQLAFGFADVRLDIANESEELGDGLLDLLADARLASVDRLI